MKSDQEHLLNHTIPQLLRWRVQNSGNKIAIREKDYGRWISFSWNDYYRYVRKCALGLKELKLETKDTIAIIGDNIPELLFISIGAQSIGAISAALYQTSLPDEIASIINYMNVRIVFCDDQEQVDKLVEVRNQIPHVKKVIYEDSRGMRSYKSDNWFMHIDDLYELGETSHISPKSSILIGSSY
jgi:long-chain acyl-CoA synthetase